MKRTCTVLSFTLLLGKSLSAQTLQDVTSGTGNTTTNTIEMLNGAFLNMNSGLIATGDAKVTLYSSGKYTNGGFGALQTSYHAVGYTTPLVLNGLGGSVGVGISSPLSKLHVNGNVIMGGGNLDPSVPGILPSLANTGFMMVGWNRSAGGGEIDLIGNRNGGSAGGFRFYDYGNNGSLTQLMEITGAGNVFLSGNQTIGTTTSQKNLDVNGVIKTRKVKVTQVDWADYVFDSAYQLPPLNVVEKFILVHKHLPEVPSATTVKNDGIDVGDSQALLLKKIEELTLYIIQQNKEMEALKKNMMEMQDKMNKL